MDGRSGLVEPAVQGFPDDLSGESAALEACCRPAGVPTAVAAAEQAGAGHLVTPGQLAQGLLGERSRNASGGQFLGDQRRAARPGPPRHQPASEGEVIEVPELAEPAQRFLHVAGRAATLQELSAQLRRGVRPEREQPECDGPGLWGPG
jgi:hypothetical protein